MTEQNPFPLKGCANQTGDNAYAANSAKEWEERVLRFFDQLERQGADPRSIAVARTSTQQAFMWAVRGIFKPTRINLPEDTFNQDMTVEEAAEYAAAGGGPVDIEFIEADRPD